MIIFWRIGLRLANLPEKRKIPSVMQFLAKYICISYSRLNCRMLKFFLFLIATRTDFIVTACQDGHVKFWKKLEADIEFVKHFRAHLGR